MSYNEDDIREIFRRAFEQGEQRRPDPESPNEPPENRPPIQLPTGFLRSRGFWFVVILFILFTSFNRIITTYTDWRWFQMVGYDAVWLTRIGAQLVTFAVFFVLALGALLLNLRLALRGAEQSSTSTFLPGQYRGFRWFLRLIAVFFSFTLASAAATTWDEWLLFFNRAPSEVVDPVFGRSLSFYFFELPIYNFLRGWLLPLTFFSIVGIIAIYALHNIEPLRRGAWQPQRIASLRRHVAVLGAAFALLIALGHYLARFGLVYNSSDADLVAGAGYTDVNISARIYLLNALLMAIVAGALLLNIGRFNLRPIIAAVALWFISVVILNGVVPAVVEQYIVQPNQLSREGEYLANNIEFTRKAFGIDDVEQREFGTVTQVSAEDLAQNEAALQNMRLWDYRLLPQNYEQLQSLRTYYQFGDVDIDRYMIDGELRQVMLSARELDKSESALPNQTWENLRLEFTHGYGIVMNPVDRFTRDGQPEFFIGDIPPVSTIDLTIERPEIYYGEEIPSDDIVYVGNPERGEFSYPSGATNVRTVYEGKGGVPVGGFFNKLAFVIRFGDWNALFNNDINPETRLMFRRQILERIDAITPFLQYDFDPYLVVADGRLLWVVDAYTTDTRYPYSDRFISGQPEDRNFNGINYIRNAAKITVDAYDGTVTYYLADESDPLVKSYAAVFPGLFRPMATMSDDLRAHIRFPETLFRIQAQQYLEYHMTDVNVFFNQEDLWEIPLETFQDAGPTELLEPYYVIFNLPGEEQTEYLLIQPYTPVQKNNMVAWMAARNDGENYGQLVAYVLPKQQVIDGPIQVEAQIEQDPEISQQLSLWNEGSSEAIRGNLIVIPLNNSFLYVEPLYLRSSGGGSRPELKRVIVASGGDVVMEDTLAQALAELVNVRATDIGNIVPLPEVDTGDDGEEVVVSDDLQSVIDSANANFEAAQTAQREGDWAAYGDALDRLERDLNQLELLIQEQP